MIKAFWPFRQNRKASLQDAAVPVLDQPEGPETTAVTIAVTTPAVETPRSGLDAPVSEQDVDDLFRVMLKRPASDKAYTKKLVQRELTIRGLISQLRTSDELRGKAAVEAENAKPITKSDEALYRVPQDLSIAPLIARRILIIGSCLSQAWANRISACRDPCESDLYLFGSPLPENPPRPIIDYDFQILQMPLRSILPDAAFARLSQSDLGGHEKLFEHSVSAIRRSLKSGMRWNERFGILTFVLPFLVPQQNPVGRMMPRYDLRNPVYFIEKLNESLAQELEAYKNAYFFDLNEVLGTFGRRFVQEDMLVAFNHGAFITNFDSAHDGNRLELAGKATDYYEERVAPMILAAWEEILSMYRIRRQADMIKLVVIDLDDTLWRGVIAEQNPDEMPSNEGWPKGLWEALALLKRRGILLAIISKNEESRVLEVWNSIVGRHLSLDDFAIRRINWRSKADNMAEILSYVNLTPGSVVFIDDNPAQRSEMKAAFPEIRVLGGSPLTWRRILLWSAETQLPEITTESSTRTAMVQAQVEREEQRHTLSQEDFLLSLKIKMNFIQITDVSNARFPRVLELINKTNQFNTTGQRWSREDCIEAFSEGAQFFAFELTDAYTDYGLVGVLILDKGSIRQFVMSCRIMGLEAEIAAVAALLRIASDQGEDTIFAAMTETERNLPCRNVYARCGFAEAAGGWSRTAMPLLPVPSHITLTPESSNLVIQTEAAPCSRQGRAPVKEMQAG